MNSEVCPFCGKTYKRLKSHLPHCKASKPFKTPSANKNVPETQASDSQLPSAPSRSTANAGTQTPSVGVHLPSEKIKHVSSSSSEAVSADAISLSSQASFSSTLSPPQSSRPSKPKKKSLRELILASKVEHFTKGSLEGAKSASKKSSLGTAKGTKTKSLNAEDSAKGVRVPLVSTEPKKKNFVAHSPDILSSYMKENSRKHKARDKFWVESDGEMEEMLLKPKVTLQDVKATLGRGNSRRDPGRTSILSTTDVTGNHMSHMRLDSDLSPAPLPLKNQEEDAESRTAAKVKLLNSDSIPTERTAVVPWNLQTFQLAPPPLLTASLNEALRPHHVTEPLPTSHRLHSPSSPLLHPPAAQSLCGRMEELQLKGWNPDAGAATQRRLGQVRLRELPEWLASRTPSHPRDVIEMVQKGWQWYYSRYIDVKKGGVAGVGMLLVGYCVLSYIWSYPHIKLSRWRKYH